MRHRSILAIAAVSALLVGATLAQDTAPASEATAPTPARSSDPALIRALDELAPPGAIDPAQLPGAVAVSGDPLADPRQDPKKGVPYLEGLPLIGDPTAQSAPEPTPVDGTSGGVWDLTTDEAGRFAGARQWIGADGRVAELDPWGQSIHWFYGTSQPGTIEIRVTVDDSQRASVTVNGSKVPKERISRSGSTLTVHDGQGHALVSFDVHSDGRVTIPEGWSFRGPAARPTSGASRQVIGIRVGTIDPALANHLGLGEGEGILVSEVIAGHPAAQAGLQAHDIILAVDGERPATLEGLRARLQKKRPGERIRLRITRMGAALEIECGVVSSRSVGRYTTLPSGSYAVASGGGSRGGAVVDFTESDAPTLIWRRNAPVAVAKPTGGGLVGRIIDPEGRPLPGARVTALPNPVDPRLPGAGSAYGRARDDFTGAMGGTRPGGRGSSAPPTRARDARLEQIQERLERLEKLLEQLLEEKQSPKLPRRTTGSLLPGPQIHGQVLAVADQLVTLSVGSDDRVAQGDTFTVYQGDIFVAQIEVADVKDQMATARVLFKSDSTPIRVGQQAATLDRPKSGGRETGR